MTQRLMSFARRRKTAGQSRRGQAGFGWCEIKATVAAKGREYSLPGQAIYGRNRDPHDRANMVLHPPRKPCRRMAGRTAIRLYST